MQHQIQPITHSQRPALLRKISTGSLFSIVEQLHPNAQFGQTVVTVGDAAFHGCTLREAMISVIEGAQP